jgi:hypothetical protein
MPSLLNKLQTKLEVNKPTSSKVNSNSLDKLPDKEKLKVIDYISAVKHLSKQANG